MPVLYTKPEDESQYIPLRMWVKSEPGQPNPGQWEIRAWVDHETWFNPYKIYSEESIEALVPELKEFILRWREKAQQEKETFVPPDYREKFAGNLFAYKDMLYEIPGMPGISNDLYAKLSADMEEELKQMGCRWVSYTGSMD